MDRTQAGIITLGAIALLSSLAAWRIPAPLELGALEWPAAAGLTALLFLLQQQGFVFHWRKESTKISLDEAGILLALLVLPPTLIVLAVAVSSAANQIIHRRAPWKTAFNTAQYTLAATLAVGVATLLRVVGVPAPWFALVSPPVFAGTTAFLVSLVFAKLDSVPVHDVLIKRFGHFILIATALGISLGLISYALFALHPLAVLATVPVFIYLRRFGRLTEWADDELKTHRLVATASAEVAGAGDLTSVADRILNTCHELFDCGEASLTLAGRERGPPLVWQRHFAKSSGFGGVAAEILGSDGSRLGALHVFPKPGQARYGEREHQLLRTVAASATAAATNAHALQAARASEERYRSLFETAHVLVHVLDEEGHVVDANPAALRALAWDPEALHEKRFSQFVDAEMDIMKALHEKGEVEGLACRLRSETGDALTVLLDAKRIGDTEPRYVVFARDITPLKSLEAELRRSMAKQHETIKRLENMNRELEEFTLWTTHDMREPLRSIGTIAEFLHEDIATIDREEARDMSRRISEGADRLKERVKALHAFSLIVQRDDEFRDVDMQRVIEDIVTSMETKIAEKGARIVLPSPSLPIVRAQAHRIDQVFANLLENALKYGALKRPDAPREEIRVEVGVEENENEWRFFVRDNGPGIAAGYHERIFQLFQRGPTSVEPGSGAGLAIVKRIAEQHGGRAWVESKAGAGATFFVALPKRVPEGPLVRIVP